MNVGGITHAKALSNCVCSVELPGSNNRMRRYFVAYPICCLIKFQHFAIPTVAVCDPRRLCVTFKLSVMLSHFQPGIDAVRYKCEAVSVLIS